MAVLAEELGVSRPTVSRRIDAGLKKLRGRLQKQGLVVAASGFGALLIENTAQSAPADLVRRLGKLALVGGKVAVTSSPAATGAGLVFAAAKTKLIAAAVVAAVIGTGLYVFKGPSGPSPTPGSGPIPPAARVDREVPRPTDVHPDQPAPPANTTEIAKSPTSPPAVAEEAPAIPEPSLAEHPKIGPPAKPADSAAEVPQEDRLDLSSPEATARSFIRAIVAGDTDAVMACFLPGGEDCDDMLDTLRANPDTPGQRADYEARCLFEALDPDAEMPMLSMDEGDRGASVRWQVTFKNAFTIEGHTFHPGDTMDFAGTMRQSGDAWLIVSL